MEDLAMLQKAAAEGGYSLWAHKKSISGIKTIPFRVWDDLHQDPHHTAIAHFIREVGFDSLCVHDPVAAYLLLRHTSNCYRLDPKDQLPGGDEAVYRLARELACVPRFDKSKLRAQLQAADLVFSIWYHLVFRSDPEYFTSDDRWQLKNWCRDGAEGKEEDLEKLVRWFKRAGFSAILMELCEDGRNDHYYESHEWASFCRSRRLAQDLHLAFEYLPYDVESQYFLRRFNNGRPPRPPSTPEFDE